MTQAEFDAAIERMKTWPKSQQDFVATLPRKEAEHILLAAALLDAQPVPHEVKT